MTTQTAPSTATATVTSLFIDRAKSSPDTPSLHRKVDGKWEQVTWQGYYDAASKIGLALKKIGLERGEKAAILSETRAEWAFCDLGILGVGGITVPIYHSNLPDEVKYILDNSEAKYLFVENLDQWKKVHGQLDQLSAIQSFIIFDTSDTETTKAGDVSWDGNERVITLDDLLELGEKEDKGQFDELARQATSDDVITYIYTSGTTGNPKGVVLTHGNAIGECEALADALPLSEDDITLAFLPLAHVFARALHWAQVHSGYQVAFAEAIPKVVDNMGEVKPTFFAAVPRIYEKIHSAVTAKIHANTGFKKSYALFGLGAAMERERRKAEQGRGPGLGLAIKCSLGGAALGKVKAGLQARTGGRIKFFISGGAPLSREIAYFLAALDFNVFEGYGLTETTAATHINRPGACKLGTVGKVVKGVDCRIAPDGEVLVKGSVILKEYFKRAEATAEALQEREFDGKTETWFHTGDIGVIDEEGFLRITDRKKDLIITAAGKNISPQNVENHIKTLPLISQVAMFGDKKKFCVALLTLDEEAARKALAAEGVEVPEKLEDLVKHERIRALVQAGINDKNADLPRYETIKYFEILPRDFEVGDELTPTLKVKRRVVKDKYGHLVDALYEAAGA